MSVKNNISNYYENYDEEGRLKTRYGLVEFLTTMKYIEKYLKKDMKICEIGAGTGRYSHALAKKGFQVDAVELVEHNIKQFKENTTDCEEISIRQGNALDLSFFEDDTYDITLLLGPMYHLFTDEDKIKALSEALRITKPGGILFVAYCISDATIISDGFKGGYIHEFIENGVVDSKTFKIISNPQNIFALHRKEEIDALNTNFDAQRLHYIASDGHTNHMREVIEAMDDKTFEAYLNFHYAICERQDTVGLTHHSLDILKKNS